MNRKFLGLMTGAVLTATVFAGCGGGGGGASSFQYDPPPGPTPPPQKTINFTIPNYAAGDQAVVVFTPVAGDEFDHATNTFQITSGNARMAGRTGDGPAASTAPADFCGLKHSKAAAQEWFDNNPRPRLDQLKARAVRPKFDGLAKGTQVEIFSPAETGDKVTVEKMLSDAQTVHCNVMAEPGLVTEAQALRLAQIFDSSNPFDPNAPGAIGIYDRLTGLCGFEWRTAGGRDGDLRINIMLMSSGNMPSGALGLVRWADPFPVSTFPTSNEGEILYLDAESLAVPAGDDFANYTFYHALAHEFHHVIMFNTKMDREGTFPNFDPNSPSGVFSVNSLLERDTLSEGFAQTAATLAGFGVYYATDATRGADPLSFSFLNFAVQRPTDDFWDAADGGYGIGHLFGLHIVRRYGPEKWGELTKSPHLGTLNLNTVLGNQTENIFHAFNISLHVTTLANAPANYVIPFISLDNLNYVRPSQSSAPPQQTFLPGIGFASDTAANLSMTQEYLPWSTILYRLQGGNGNPLNLQINIPIRARAGVVHESPAGTFSSVQAP